MSSLPEEVSSAPNLDSLAAETIVVHIVPYLSTADTATLAKSCGRLLRVLRRERLYHLWPLYNRKFVEDAAFREEVKSFIPVDRLVLYGWKELADLSSFAGVHSAIFTTPDRFSDDRCSATKLGPLRGVHTVALSFDYVNMPSADEMAYLADVRVLTLGRYKGPLPPLRKAQSVHLRSVNTPDLSFLEGVRRVRLDGCRRNSVNPNTRHRDLSALRLAHFVDIDSVDDMHLGMLENAREVVLCTKHVVGLPSSTHLRSFTWHHSPLTSIPRELGGLRFLDLSESRDLFDVSAAGRIKTLLLRGCWRVKDVSMLGAAHTLELSMCSNLDVSALGRAHTLRLTKMHGLVGLASLEGVHELVLAQSRFEWTDEVRRALGTAHTLDLSRTDVSDVSSFGRVHTLRLHWTGRRAGPIKGLPTLHNCHTLDLSLSSIEDVSALGHVHTLNLQDAPVKDVSALGNVSVLNLSHCDVSDVSKLGSIRILNIAYCWGVTDVSALGRVHTLNLENCGRVKDVSQLGGVYHLNIAHTPVTDVSMLGGVHTLILDGCRVTDVSRLEHVCVLSVKGCPIADRASLLRVRKVVE